MSRTLVAGIGNIFLGDDGFGSVVARHLAQTPLPPDVEVADIGIRGVHLAYQLLDGYDTLVLVDAMPRGEEAGTVTVLETSLADHAAGNGGPPVDEDACTRGCRAVPSDSSSTRNPLIASAADASSSSTVDMAGTWAESDTRKL